MPAECGQPEVRQSTRQGPEYRHPVRRQVRRPAHDDRGDHRDQQAWDPGVDRPGRQHDCEDTGRYGQICRTYLRKRADNVDEPGRGARVHHGYPQHVGELPGGHLDADAGEESDQDGTGQEVRQEPEPGQPGQQQQAAGEQGGKPGQPDVLRRADDRITGKGRTEDGSGGGVRTDD